jgi:hypothetical protein
MDTRGDSFPLRVAFAASFVGCRRNRGADRRDQRFSGVCMPARWNFAKGRPPQADAPARSTPAAFARGATWEVRRARAPQSARVSHGLCCGSPAAVQAGVVGRVRKTHPDWPRVAIAHVVPANLPAPSGGCPSGAGTKRDLSFNRRPQAAADPGPPSSYLHPG